MLRSSHGAPKPRGRGGGAAPPAGKDKPKRAVAAPARPSAAAAAPPREPKELAKAKRPKAASAQPELSEASDEARDLASAIAISALDKKASGLEVIDVAGRVDYADFLVLMSGRSDRHVAALSQAIEDALRKKGRRALSVEGLPNASWVLMDFGDVVVHVFQDDARSTYDLDGLWMDARRIPVPLPEGP
ncbi:MAG: ribosome silencing factor [Myxococcales bacterium]|nr:ribosome silencing factor [Myxococcales bacterium]